MQPTSSANALTFIDRTAARWADGLIGMYQRWLSPLKGRDRGCAHRVRYGGN